MGWPVAGFHSRTAPSASVLAGIVPSGAESHPAHAALDDYLAGAGGLAPLGSA